MLQLSTHLCTSRLLCILHSSLLCTGQTVTSRTGAVKIAQQYRVLITRSFLPFTNCLEVSINALAVHNCHRKVSQGVFSFLTVFFQPLFSLMAPWPVLLFLWVYGDVQLSLPKDAEWTAYEFKAGNQLHTCLLVS